MKTFTFKLLSAILFATTTLQASAGLMLSFSEPDGIVSPNESIEIWITMATDTDFIFDSTDKEGDRTFGNLDEAGIFIPTSSYANEANNGQGESLSFDTISVELMSFFLCSNTFTEGCSTVGGNYNFELNNEPSTMLNLSSFSLLAGESIQYLFGTFVPVTGGAELGQYNYPGTILSLRFSGTGTDSTGQKFDLTAFTTLARTCLDVDPSCATFTRTVVASKVSAPNALFIILSSICLLVSCRKFATNIKTIS